MLGAALGRRVYFDLDVHRVYPLINLLLIGPSGIGKSTALRDIALKQLISPLPDGPTKPMVCTGKSTKEAMHQDLMTNPHSIILASELSNLFSKEKYNEGMIPYITDLLDLAPTRVRTKSGGSLIIQSPECCILGGSTKEWLQEMLPTTSAEGGFLPRFLIVKEDYKFQRVADPRRSQTDQQRRELDVLRTQAYSNFTHVVSAADGLFDFDDYSASDAYSNWYQTFLPESGTMAPFAARAGAHVLRLSLLVALSRFGTGITLADIRAGMGLYQYTQRQLSSVVVPMSPQGRLMGKLVEALGNESRSAIELRRAMRNHCGGADVDRMLVDLVRNQEVLLEGNQYRRINA